MKKILSILTLSLIPFICFGQIKKYVCSVHEVFYDHTIEDMKDFAEGFRKSSLPEFADSLEEYIDGGSFGSGFVYVAENGKNYIITNRHVVEQAKTLKVNFIDEDNKVTTYEGLTIVSVGQDLDIALLAFPDDVQPFQEGLPLYTGSLEDGAIVYTAGFPGYDGKPSWQLGTGNVTNAKMIGTKLVDPSITHLIQHSAQVDSGNSGGPLLRKGKTSPYLVIGINTWKAINRQDTNFSIPAKAIQNFVKKSLSENQESDPVEEITARAKSFQKLISNPKATYEDIIPYISMEYVSREGKTTFEYVMKTATDNAKKTIASAFFRESPIEGMRYAIAWNIFQEYHKGEFSNSPYIPPKTVADLDENDLTFEGPVKEAGTDKWSVTYDLNTRNGHAKAVWINMYGIWQLEDFENVKSKTKSKITKTENPYKGAGTLGGLKIYMPYKVSLDYRFGIPVSKTGAMFPNDIDIDVKINNYLAVEATFEGIISSYHIVSGTDTYFPFNSMSGLLGVRAQIPVIKGTTVTMPYLTVQGGAKMNMNPTAGNSILIPVQAKAGAKFIFGANLAVKTYFDAGAAYNYNFTLNKTDKDIYTEALPFMYFGFGFGF